jgi:hypothetical protein
MKKRAVNFNKKIILTDPYRKPLNFLNYFM